MTSSFVLPMFVLLVSALPLNAPAALPDIPDLPAHEPRPDEAKVAQVLNAIQSSAETFQKPTYQDREGRGLVPEHAENFLDGAQHRSEDVYPPFIMGPRRQTDSLVRQAYLLLPEKIRSRAAFVLPERITQNPEAYLPYLRSRTHIYIFGSLVGIGFSTDYTPVAQQRHGRELWQLEQTIRLALALDLKVMGVYTAMGDSPSPKAKKIRLKLQGQRDALLAATGLSHLSTPISWGADELPFVAFANALPPISLSVEISNPEASQFYDGKRRADEVVREKIAELGFSSAPLGQAQMHAAFLTRRPGGDDVDFQPDDAVQRSLDAEFLGRLLHDPSELIKKTALVDLRLYNGSWDSLALPKTCAGLSFGGWGTSANKIGATLGLGKLLLFKGNETITEQLWLESFAHDVFAIGYEEAQRGEFAHRLLNLDGIQLDHWAGYASREDLEKVFKRLNSFVNERMKAHFSEAECFKGREVRFSPQLWRTFESEVHLWPVGKDDIFAPGVYRLEGSSFANFMNPHSSPSGHAMLHSIKVNLQSLVSGL